VGGRLTPRLAAAINARFPRDAEFVRAVLEDLDEEGFGGQDPERVRAAIFFMTAGDLNRLGYAIDLLRVDWRDVLVFGGLGNADWPAVMDRELGRA
jgi:hypothetical protein